MNPRPSKPIWVSTYMKRWRKKHFRLRRQRIREAALLKRRKPLIHNGRKP